MSYKDPEIKKAYNREYSQKNKERKREQTKKWHEENPEKVKANRKRWQERNPKWQQNRKEEKIKWLIELYGAKKLHCDRCRYNTCFQALHFHHKRPEQKKDRFDSMNIWLKRLSLEDFKKKVFEIDFIILCSNCHAELHAGLWKYGE